MVADLRSPKSLPTTRRAARGAALALVLVAPFLAGCGDSEALARADADRAALRAEVEKLRKDLDKVTETAGKLRGDVASHGRDIAELGERVAAVEARPSAAPAAGGAAAPAVAAGPAAPDKKAQIDEMEDLRKKVFDGTATEDEERRFWELARTTGRIDELMKSLEAKVKENPNDVAGRMDLAQAYIAKLLSIPGGPEQGLWSNKAEAQWQAVLKLEPENWDARYGVAFNWSMWPDFLNKTPDAVREFEKLKDVQERQTPAAKHVQTYFQLSRLYMKQGKADKAREILRTGLARHPGDAELTKALDSLSE